MHKRSFSWLQWRYYSTLVGSLFVVLILSRYQLPAFMSWLYPDWLLLWVLFWSAGERYGFSSVWIWVAGLAMDLLNNSLLGLHVASYLLVYYLLCSKAVRAKARLQQNILLSLGVVLSVLMQQWGMTYMLHTGHYFQVVLQGLVTALLWISVGRRLLHMAAGRHAVARVF